MNQQTTSRPPPQQAHPAARGETLILAVSALATLVVLACADTVAAQAYRQALVQLFGGGA